MILSAICSMLISDINQYLRLKYILVVVVNIQYRDSPSVKLVFFLTDIKEYGLYTSHDVFLTGQVVIPTLNQPIVVH